MRIALIHENPEYMRKFAQRYLGEHDISLFDRRLDPWEIIEGLEHIGGGLNLILIGVCDHNLSASEYAFEISKRYKYAKVVMVEPELGVSQYSLNPSFPQGDMLVSEQDIFDGLESFV
jgi:hypothetical protein